MYGIPFKQFVHIYMSFFFSLSVEGAFLRKRGLMVDVVERGGDDHGECALGM
jgi:hypothetical protein